MTEPQKKRQIRTKPQEMFGRLGFVCLFACLVVCLLAWLFVRVFVCLFFPTYFCCHISKRIFHRINRGRWIAPLAAGEPLIVLRNDG